MAAAALALLIIITFIIVYRWYKKTTKLIKDSVAKTEERLRRLEIYIEGSPAVLTSEYEPIKKPKVILRTEAEEAEKYRANP